MDPMGMFHPDRCGWNNLSKHTNWLPFTPNLIPSVNKGRWMPSGNKIPQLSVFESCALKIEETCKKCLLKVALTLWWNICLVPKRFLPGGIIKLDFQNNTWHYGNCSKRNGSAKKQQPNNRTMFSIRSFMWGPKPTISFEPRYMGGSENSGTPKSSIFIGFSIINHPFWGTTILGNPHVSDVLCVFTV